MTSSFRIERQYVTFASGEVPRTAIEPTVTDALYEAQLEAIRAQAQQTLEEAREQARRIAEEARMEAAEILEDARTQAAKITQDAHRQAEIECCTAREQGYAEGAAQAQEEAEQRHCAEAHVFSELLERLRGEYREMADSMEDDMIGLIVEIARKVLFLHLDREEAVMQTLVRETIAQIKDADTVEVHLSTQDYKRYFGDARSRALLQTEKTTVEFVEESTFAHGDCVVETADTVIDCGVTRQLDAVNRCFTEERDGDAT